MEYCSTAIDRSVYRYLKDIYDNRNAPKCRQIESVEFPNSWTDFSFIAVIVEHAGCRGLLIFRTSTISANLCLNVTLVELINARDICSFELADQILHLNLHELSSSSHHATPAVVYSTADNSALPINVSQLSAPSQLSTNQPPTLRMSLKFTNPDKAAKFRDQLLSVVPQVQTGQSCNSDEWLEPFRLDLARNRQLHPLDLSLCATSTASIPNHDLEPSPSTVDSYRPTSPTHCLDQREDGSSDSEESHNHHLTVPQPTPLFSASPDTSSSSSSTDSSRQSLEIGQDASLALLQSSSSDIFVQRNRLPPSLPATLRTDDSLAMNGQLDKLTPTNQHLTSSNSVPAFQLVHNHYTREQAKSHLSNLTAALVDSNKPTFLADSLYRRQIIHSDPHIVRQLKRRSCEYSSFDSIRTCVASWNVNGRFDPEVNELVDWIMPPDSEPLPDIVAIGIQELELSLGSVTVNKTQSVGLEQRWKVLLERSLVAMIQYRADSSGVQIDDDLLYYSPLQPARLAGILLLLFASNRLPGLAGYAIQTVPTGVLNMIGNKGAAGVRFTVCNTSFCFVNCHLAAGESKMAKRDQDQDEIMSRMLFGHSGHPIRSHDIVYVFGDLNYRIKGVDDVQVRDYINRRDYKSLLVNDELIHQRRLKVVFTDFQEGQITFAPTYKFDLQTQDYVATEKRTPSYCDRIMWLGKRCQLVSYRAHPQFTLSDHKPVSGHFKVGIRRVDPTAFENVLQSVMNYWQPKAHLDCQEVEFGLVSFLQPSRRQLIRLTNTGSCTLKYEFTENEVSRIPSWLSVDPLTKQVEPGQTIDIALQALVKPDHVASLNAGRLSLSVILVLHLVKGKDYFVSVTGRFVPTSFGLPLSTLLNLPNQPVGLIDPEQLCDLIEQTRPSDSPASSHKTSPVASNSPHTNGSLPDFPFAVPKEVYRLVDCLAGKVDQSDLFPLTDCYDDFDSLRRLLDNTEVQAPIPKSISTHSLFTCLLLFLACLDGCVIPAEFRARCLQSGTNFWSAVKCLSFTPYCPFIHPTITLAAIFGLVFFGHTCTTTTNSNTTNKDTAFKLIPPSLTESKGRQGFESEARFVKQFLTRSDNQPSSVTWFNSDQKEASLPPPRPPPPNVVKKSPSFSSS